MSKTGIRLIETTTLPTHMALVARRLNRVGPSDSANSFLCASYVVETLIKTVVIVLRAGLKQNAPEHAYRIAFDILRADGLGVWERVLRELTSLPLAGFLPPDFRNLVTWATQRRGGPEDQWASEMYHKTQGILEMLGAAAEGGKSSRISINHVLTALVQIRNKTKAHGAVGEDFYDAANGPYIEVTRGLVETCPALAWRWLRLSTRANGTICGVDLRGAEPSYMRDAESTAYRRDVEGIHFLTTTSVQSYPCNDVLRCDRECSAFLLPNGGAIQSQAEFIDYGTGKLERLDISEFSLPPAKLPLSETHGFTNLDIQSNVIGNLPTEPRDYVQRLVIEKELHERLLDRNHTIITLHGRGGVGKTYLALHVAHDLARLQIPPFEYIVWFSARDVDLTITGPKAVLPAVTTLEDVCNRYGGLFGTDPSVDGFAATLQDSRAHKVTQRHSLHIRQF